MKKTTRHSYSLLGKSMVRVFYKNEELLKEVIEVTEPILELEYEKMEKYLRKHYDEYYGKKFAELSVQKEGELS